MNDTLLENTILNASTSTIIVEKLFQKITLGCLLSCLSIFTVCGNILVLYAIQTEKNLRTVSNLFILSLAFADLAVGLFVMPLSAATIIAGRWPFSSVICKMWLSIDYVASTASIFNLVLLSLDRYWAVVYPLRYLRKRTRRRATIFILIVWFISSLWAPAVIFWSYVAPQHSDIIKKDECDTSFRSNKTFKTLTALVNFYLPLLTMIIISCRIMVAIRSRSKMELGRRISSATQKQMKDRTNTISSIRMDNPINSKIDEQSTLTPTIVPTTLTLSIEGEHQSIPNNNNNLIPMIERGECFCSTCQTLNGNDNNNLWQLQQTPIQITYSSVQKRLSFAQINPISMIFSSTTNLNKNQDSYDKSSNKTNLIRNSLSVSNNMKYSMIINSNGYENKNLLSNTNTKIIKPSISRTSSIASSFSDEFFDLNSTEKEFKSKQHEKQTAQASVTFNNSHLKVPIKILNKPIKNPSKHTSTKMNIFTFFNTLINPSHSSSLQRELKAARQLGMLVGVFTVSWLPYFILFLVVAWCNTCVSDRIFTASIWLGYLNSTFNPLIYPLCNTHFRHAFQKICYCKHEKTKIPNLNALRELQVLHSMRQRR